MTPEEVTMLPPDEILFDGTVWIRCGIMDAEIWVWGVAFKNTHKTGPDQWDDGALD